MAYKCNMVSSIEDPGRGTTATKKVLLGVGDLMRSEYNV